MGPTEGVGASSSAFFFELSHPTRLEILRLIGIRPERLTRIAETLDARHPEVSRHLERLQRANLAEKTPEGTYRATAYALLILSSLGSLEFLVSHERYFRDHDLRGLPPHFIQRLGELASFKPTEGTFSIFHEVDKIMGGARKRLTIFTEELPDNTFPPLISKFGTGISIRVILDETLRDLEPPKEIRHLFRVVPRIPAAGVISERMACLSFPDRGGRLDYSAYLSSEDSAFVGWCEDLAELLWTRGNYLK